MPTSSKKYRKARNVDAESGKNRVSSHKKKVTSNDSESEDYLSSDSDLESELDMPAKDDSRRRKGDAPKSARKDALRDGRSRARPGEEDSNKDLADEKKKETGSTVAPHMAILTAVTYHIGLSSISRPAHSSFIPSCYNYFWMVYQMTSLVVDNTYLHEICPGFFSPVLFLYYGHVYFYHLLRARNAAGTDVLTRLEKRALTYYERVGPLEAWPIAAPLLGMLSYLGAHKTEDPMYGWIAPAFPDFSKLKKDGVPNCLGSLDTMTGSARIPLIPALQKMIFNFATGVADFNNGMFRPVGQDAIDPTHTFCGLNSSSATTNAFLALSGNLGWNAPLETGDTLGPFDYDIKRARIRRWNIPDVPDNADLSSLTGFLGFVDNVSFDWMSHLLSTAAAVNRFFPGSGNLSQVSPLSTIGMATLTSYKRNPAVTTTGNKWFYDRSGLFFSTQGYTNTEGGLLDTKMSLAVSPNAKYDSKHYCVSVAPVITLERDLRGPFFVDDQTHADYERKAVIVTENTRQTDPGRRFQEFLAPTYDPRAGRA